MTDLVRSSARSVGCSGQKTSPALPVVMLVTERRALSIHMPFLPLAGCSSRILPTS